MSSDIPVHERPAGLALYGYFRSSASFRVRIALNLKGLRAEYHAIHLLRGEQHAPGHLALNPQGLVPVLVHEGRVIRQSLAIVEYLDEIAPLPPLLPGNAYGRARAREIAYAIACDIHPLSNLRVLRHLETTSSFGDAEKRAWQRHWMTRGFGALERLLSAESGRFCVGETPTIADLCLIPQLANARRVDFDLSAYPRLTGIEAVCMTLPAFADAAPQRQADAE